MCLHSGILRSFAHTHPSCLAQDDGYFQFVGEVVWLRLCGLCVAVVSLWLRPRRAVNKRHHTGPRALSDREGAYDRDC